MTGTGNHDPAWLREGEDAKKPLLLPPPEAKAESADLGDGDEEAGGSVRKSHRGQKRLSGAVGRKGKRAKRITKPFFAILGTVTALAALAAVAANLYVLVSDGQQEKPPEQDNVDRIILRGFGVALAFISMLTELRLKWWGKLCPVLDVLLVRGLFHALVAFLTLSDFSHWTEPNNVVGLIVLCCAGLYTCAGLLCIRRHVEVEK